MASPTRPTRIAVLISGGGSNLAALLAAARSQPAFGGEIVVVGSDRASAAGLARAVEAGIPTVVRELAPGDDRAVWERSLADGIAEHEPEVVVLAGFMRILSGAFLARWPDRVVNTHPSLLPAFRGAHAVRDALAYGVALTGCTIHLVDEQVDHGPILAQRAVHVLPDDTEETLHERIKAVEHVLLPSCVEALCQDRVRIEGRRAIILPPGPPRAPTPEPEVVP
ncbi:MAG: phosphoribosylglycinamide formyltransferase [Nitriliruptoraceae bacterium]